jgi:hypothetical protein
MSPVTAPPATIATSAFNRKLEPTTADPPTATPDPDSNSCARELGSGTRPSERIEDAFKRKARRARKMSVSTAGTETARVSAISA